MPALGLALLGLGCRVSVVRARVRARAKVRARARVRARRLS